jgi:hypothetical protein
MMFAIKTAIAGMEEKGMTQALPKRNRLKAVPRQ